MNQKNIFGTDGIRGVANQYPITADVALAMGKAIALLFTERQSKRIVIGKDTRKSNYMIETALAAGICSMGVNTIFLGPIPTPGLAFITESMRADAGVMISASHNPYYDNGIKLFSHDGFKLPDAMEQKISEMISNNHFPAGPTHEKIGTAYRIEEAGGRYITYLKSTFPKGLRLDGITIVVDCANGAGYKVAPALFEELGAKVIALGVDPNGTNINENCGALHPDQLAAEVKLHEAHVGIAIDGDADRLIMVDEAGNIVDGDSIMALCAVHLKEQQALKHNTLVSTVMSNLGVEQWLLGQGISMLRTQVGDRYVMDAMIKGKFSLGGEQSGHMIFLDYSTTGDGLLSSLRVLEIMKRSGKSLHDLSSHIPRYPQLLSKIKVTQKKPWEDISKCQQLVTKIEKELGSKGRLLLRYSGTEPVFRIMIEGEDAGAIKNYMADLEKTFSQELGA